MRLEMRGARPKEPRSDPCPPNGTQNPNAPRESRRHGQNVTMSFMLVSEKVTTFSGMATFRPQAWPSGHSWRWVIHRGHSSLRGAKRRSNPRRHARQPETRQWIAASAYGLLAMTTARVLPEPLRTLVPLPSRGREFGGSQNVRSTRRRPDQLPVVSRVTTVAGTPTPTVAVLVRRTSCPTRL